MYWKTKAESQANIYVRTAIEYFNSMYKEMYDNRVKVLQHCKHIQSYLDISPMFPQIHPFIAQC